MGSVCALGCAPRAQPAAAARAPRAPSPALAASKASANPVWRYDVHLESGRELAVEASFDGTRDEVFAVDQAAARFVQKVEVQVEVANGASFVAAEPRGPGFHVPCRAGCRVRYRFALAEAANALNDIDTAIASGDALMAPPSTWLLSPLDAPSGGFLQFRVDPGANGGFASGFRRSDDGDRNSYLLPAGALDESSFTALGAIHVAEVPAGDTTVRLAVAPKALSLTEAEAEAWLSASAGAVANYYLGHLPARHTLVVIMKGSGTSTRGETLGGGGPAVMVRAGDSVNAQTTRDDWIVVHELLHANFPDLGRPHAWLSEGLATYVEPIARARIGQVDDQKFWRDLVEGLPQGLPQPGDRGLENTHTWGRTYWGGALFCLLADVTIRERTNNVRSLDDVIRWIGSTGDADDVHWAMRQFIDAGQRATGTAVLRELYESLAEKPGTVNLSELFARLGVKLEQGVVSFDDAAPLANIRRAITAH